MCAHIFFASMKMKKKILPIILFTGHEAVIFSLQENYYRKPSVNCNHEKSLLNPPVILKNTPERIYQERKKHFKNYGTK
jgi:hypothetical protein